MLRYYYGNAIHTDLAAGLSINMVIELYNENNVRVGGGTQGRKTEAYSQFVPGGNSQGGRLPKKSAETRWRQNKGRRYFLEELRFVQKEGAQLAARSNSNKVDKKAYFALTSDTGSKEAYLIQAPILSVAIKRGPLPEEYKNDFLEFMRAYRSAFVYWLMTHAKSPLLDEASDKLFSRFLLALEASSEFQADKILNSLTQKIYGQPISDEKAENAGLERQFLDWLSQAR